MGTQFFLLLFQVQICRYRSDFPCSAKVDIDQVRATSARLGPAPAEFLGFPGVRHESYFARVIGQYGVVKLGQIGSVSPKPASAPTSEPDVQSTVAMCARSRAAGRSFTRVPLHT